MVRLFLRVLALLCLLPLSAHADGRSIIVLDASGSMWGQIDGRPKLDLAREALAEVVGKLPEGSEVGLMAYGHREKGSCEDIELIVPPAAGTGPEIIAAANKLNFLGKTPLTEAVRRAAADLRSTEDKATVILITDGIETCEADPCALGNELEKTGVDFTAHVVGFGLSDEEGKQVACLAENTGGQYIQASDLDSLTLALETTVIVAPDPAPAQEPVPAPEPAAPAALEINFQPTAVMAPGVPKPDDNTDIAWKLYTIGANGEAGEQLWTEYNDMKTKVEPGTYRLVTIVGDVTVTQDVTLTADELSKPEIVLNAARLILRPVGSEGGPVLDQASLNITGANGLDSTNYGESRFYIPAGDITVTGKAGAAEATETLSMTAGQDLTRDFLIGSGVAGIEGYYTEGLQMDSGNHSITVLAAKKKIDGSQQSFGTDYGTGRTFTLPPGDYIARVEIGSAMGESAFTVKIGERVDVPVILNAGVLYVSAPGAVSIEVLDGKKDINGNEKTLDFHYGEEVTFTAAAGDLLVRAGWGNEVFTDEKAVVTAGERTEITLKKP